MNLEPPRDPDLVDCSDARAVETWTRCLRISRRDLERAVEVAGPEVGAVYDYIQRSKQLRDFGSLPAAVGREAPRA